MLNIVYLRSSRLKVLHYWLDSCIANKAEKFELEMAYWMHLEGFQVVSSHFWALVCTGLTGRGHRSDRSECWFCSHVAHQSDWSGLSCCSCPVSSGVLHAFVQGELHWFRGSLHVCSGSSLLEHSFVSDVSSRCPCLRGPRLVFFK
jgi:hypothetical protein